MANPDSNLDTLRSMLVVQTSLREQAEKYNKDAKSLIINMLETYCPEEVDRRMKIGEAFDSLPIKVLGDLLKEKINLRLARAESILASRGSEVDQMETAMAAARRDREELKAAQERIVELERENRQLRTEFATYRQTIQSGSSEPAKVIEESAKTIIKEISQTVVGGAGGETAAQPEVQSWAGETDWMERWKASANFERDSSCLKLIGETGLSRRPLIEAKLAESFGIKAAGGSIDNLIKRIRDVSLIEILQPWEPGSKPASRGSYPDIIRLTERGRSAFKALFSQEAKVSEYDALLPAHQSPEHTLLNLYSKDILLEAGYIFVSDAPDLPLPGPGGGFFKPDIVVRDADSNMLYVEVERDTKKSLRPEKWRNAHDAGGGKIYVICENRNTMAMIRNELNYALTEYTAYLSSIPDVQAGKRGAEDSIWLEVKHKERRFSS